MPVKARWFLLAFALCGPTAIPASAQSEIDKQIASIMPKVVAWRRDIHQHPELSNREFRTSQTDRLSGIVEPPVIRGINP